MTAPGSMIGVHRALTQVPRQGRGRVVMIIAARPGEGVSTVARGVAQAIESGVTLLLDLDLHRNGQFRAFADASFSMGPGLSDAIDGRLKGQSLYRLIGMDGRARQEVRSALSFHRVGRSKLFVAGFDQRAVLDSDRLQIPAGPGYWQAVRQSCELCVVDAPAVSRSRIGLSVSARLDGVVIVASGHDGSVTATLGLKTELQASGAKVLGVVYTRADSVALSIERPEMG